MDKRGEEGSEGKGLLLGHANARVLPVFVNNVCYLAAFCDPYFFSFLLALRADEYSVHLLTHLSYMHHYHCAFFCVVHSSCWIPPSVLGAM